LNELLEKDRKWVWNERCNRAFLKVKDMITSDVVLTHYDPNLPVRCITLWSRVSIMVFI